MFSDWKIASKCATLEEYHRTLYDAQAKAHGADYMLVHHELEKYLPECESYTELGINQGATLATVVLKQPKKVRAYDIKLEAYQFADGLFNTFCDNHGIDYQVIEGNTHKVKIADTDLMYIDTVHMYDHLMKELNLHASNVKKYIVFHDTTISQSRKPLNVAVKDFVAKHPEWEIITECKISVGFMTIKRKA